MNDMDGDENMQTVAGGQIGRSVDPNKMSYGKTPNFKKPSLKPAKVVKVKKVGKKNPLFGA